KFGVELRRLDTSYSIQQNSINVGFSRNQTARPGSLSNTGLEFASFLLGQVNSTVLPLRGEVLPYIRTYQASMYAQDDFKVTPRLTLNYGLRFDIFTPLTDLDNNYSIIDTTKPNPFAGNLPGVYVFAGQNGVGNRIAPADKNQNNFGPRIGFAYKLNDNTVVRSGYGISYFQTGAYGGGNNIGFTDGYWIDNTAISPNQIDAAFTLANGYPQNQLIVPPLISESLGVGSGITVRYWDPDAAKAAYSQNWNLNVQRQIFTNLSIDVGYVGSKGTHLPTRTDINQLDPKYLEDPSIRALLNSNINATAVVNHPAGFKPPYPGFNLRLGQALRPFPQFPNMFPGGRSSDNSGNSTYHSLQATVQKRFSGGLYASGAYTWSQWLSDAPNNFVNNASINRNIYDRSLSKTYPSAHRPHTLAVSFNYELPVGPGKPFLGNGGIVGKIVGGWQLNGILRYQHGNRLGISAPQTNPIYDGTVGIVGAESALAIPQTADRVSGVPMKLYTGGDFNPKDPTVRYLNPAAYRLPTGIFGNTREFVDGLFGWRFFNEDIGLIKKTQITEGITWDLRLEAFNAFNRTRFGNPSTNIGNPQTFGRVTSASGQRQGQIAMKITF
ncbi:MAG: TonB-dependent receptor, partial [Candidatus Korobacteraceae bacterium]